MKRPLLACLLLAAAPALAQPLAPQQPPALQAAGEMLQESQQREVMARMRAIAAEQRAAKAEKDLADKALADKSIAGKAAADKAEAEKAAADKKPGPNGTP